MFFTQPIDATERTALAAARAEGRTEGAEDIQRLVGRWMNELERIAGAELGADGLNVITRFAGALAMTLAGKIEEYRREQVRAIDHFVIESRREESARS